jgi:hypothetical protein
MKLHISTALLAAAALCGGAAADPKAYQDPQGRYAIQVPDGWSDPAGGMATSAADRSVTCTITATPNKATEGQTQEQVNAMVTQTYNGDVWAAQFFDANRQGEIEGSGIRRIDIYDAPWAKGWSVFRDTPKARFGVIVVQAPGRIVSATCTGEEAAYLKIQDEAAIVLNSLRPI